MCPLMPMKKLTPKTAPVEAPETPVAVEEAKVKPATKRSHKKVSKTAPKEVAEANVTVTTKVGREEPEVVKQGLPLDHAVKHEIPQATEIQATRITPRIGVSKGVTLNMDNYESLRVDVWMTADMEEAETPKMAFDRVGALLDEVLQDQIDKSQK